MTGPGAGYSGGDAQDVDALITDRYLESILSAHGRGADRGPTTAAIDRLDPSIVFAIERLANDLPRLHPSFRFEEALAAKLGAAAARMRQSMGSSAGSGVVALADRGVWPSGPMASADDPEGTLVDPRAALGRPLLIGGALTSAALSIAGAAYVAWRIRHPQTSAMARAVRAVARTRPA